MARNLFRLMALGFCALAPHAVLAQAVNAEEAQEISAPYVPAKLDADGLKIVAASNAFTLDLLRKASAPTENTILSPASVSMAVGFAYRGAAGQTARELQTALHYPFAPAENLRASKGVLDSLELSTPNRELHAANALWLQSGMPFNADFESEMASLAKAGLNRFDFKAEPEAGRLAINGWVGDTTRGKIPKLLGLGIITAGTRAVLVNALYFKANWALPFAPKATKDEPFTAIAGKKSPVALMTQRGNYQVAHKGGVKAILLPYAGGEISLAVFLPDKASGLPEFETGLTPEKLETWFKSLEHRDTIVSLPKFSLRWNADLKDHLGEMGAPIAFSNAADFSGMAKLPYSGGDPKEVGLKISHVIHGATLDVDEKGSEATAATAVIMSVIIISGRRGPPPPPPFIFRADKPFLFALRDNRTGLILFIGRYVTP
jgi:serpin B